MTEDEKFLKRWSRRKAATAQPAPHPPAAEEDRAKGAVAASADTPAGADAEDDKPSDIDLDALPDIDSMDANSDFSVFMQDGIPEALRTRALRKLWQTDPVFNVVDGLVEYGEDFSDLATVAEGVKTAYKVGKGMVDDDDEAEHDNAADDDDGVERSDDATKRDESDGNVAVGDDTIVDGSSTVSADDTPAEKKTEDS